MYPATITWLNDKAKTATVIFVEDAVTANVAFDCIEPLLDSIDCSQASHESKDSHGSHPRLQSQSQEDENSADSASDGYEIIRSTEHLSANWHGCLDANLSADWRTDNKKTQNQQKHQHTNQHRNQKTKQQKNQQKHSKKDPKIVSPHFKTFESSNGKLKDEKLGELSQYDRDTTCSVQVQRKFGDTIDACKNITNTNSQHSKHSKSPTTVQSDTQSRSGKQGKHMYGGALSFQSVRSGPTKTTSLATVLEKLNKHS